MLQFTLLIYALNGNNASSHFDGYLEFSEGDAVDFIVQAEIGHLREINKSGWSNTQTVTIPEASTSTSPSPNPTPTYTVPEFSLLVVIPLIFGVFAIAMILRHKKTTSQNKPNV